jgi:hypothetical protein
MLCQVEVDTLKDLYGSASARRFRMRKDIVPFQNLILMSREDIGTWWQVVLGAICQVWGQKV